MLHYVAFNGEVPGKKRTLTIPTRGKVWEETLRAVLRVGSWAKEDSGISSPGKFPIPFLQCFQSRLHNPNMFNGVPYVI